MSLIEWLKSFPDENGEPTGKVLPGLWYLILVEVLIVGLVILIFGEPAW